MSLDSWKAEFYKDPADAVSKEAALSHSILKWRGLRPENMARHGVQLIHQNVLVGAAPDDQDEGLDIDNRSCALCYHYCATPGVDESCRSCPLKLARGVPCDETRPDERCSPYTAFVGGSGGRASGGDTGPMLAWLLLADDLQKAAVPVSSVRKSRRADKALEA